MKRTTSFLARALMMLVAVHFSLTGARADELTVYDGEDGSNTIPFFGMFADTQGAASECVIPSNQLTAMAGCTITAMKFYIQQAAGAPWTGTHQVYLGEVEETTLTGITGPDAFTVVKTASFDATGTELTVEFDTPYTYHGGNLLIGTYVSVAGNYKTTYFYCLSQDDNTAWYRTNPSDAGEGQPFLPKTTFTYTSGSGTVCDKPTNLMVNYTGGTEATVSWVSEESNFDIDVNGTVTEDVENPCILTGLELATRYDIKVRAKNDKGVSEWAGPICFTTDLSDDMCQIKLVINDSFGDGWTNNAIRIVDVATGYIFGQFSLAKGYQGTLIVSVPNDRDIKFLWVKGSYPNECSWAVYDVNEDLVFEGTFVGTDNNDIEDGLELYTWHVDCTISPWWKPADLAASEIGSRRATLSWTEMGTATEWVVAYKTDDVTEFTEVNTAENPFTLTGLTPMTTYTAKVRPAGENEKWSNAISFTTDIAFPAPKELAADKVKATSAEISWAGDADASSYKLRYKVAPLGETQVADFEDSSMGEWTTIDADGDGYNWVLGSAAIGTYLTDNGSTAGNGNNESHDYITSGSYTNAHSSALTPDNWLVSPLVALGGSISFYACGADPQYSNEHFGVAVSTTSNTDPNAFTMLDEWTLNADGTGSKSSRRKSLCTWGLFTVDLSAYAGQQGYVAIRHFNCSDQFLIRIDDITIEQPNGTEGTWTLVEGATNPYTIKGLAPEVTYLVEVQAVYDGSESEWTATRFTTLANTVPADLQTVDVAHTSATLSWTGAQDSYKLRYRSAAAPDPSAPATIILEAHDVWGDYDDSGYQMLLDADATAFGNEIPETVSLYTASDYSAFEYLIPENAECSGTTKNIVWNGSATIQIPAGVYDWCIINPEPGTGKLWIATDGGDVPCRNNDYVFEAGKTYHFTMGFYNTGDGAALEITRNWGEWTEVDNIADTSYEFTGLTPGTEYEWQVQGIYSGGTTEWSEAATFTTKELLELADNATNNSTIIAANEGRVTDVQLTGRTLYKDGEWNTICLPFALDATNLAASPLADGDIRTLDNIAVVGTTAALNFTAEGAVTEIEAGKPYLIRWTSGKHIVSPLFTGVAVTGTMNDVVCTSGEKAVTFRGNYDKMTYSEDNTSVLFIDDDNNLGYPLAGASIGALRGYFQLAGLTADGIEFVTNINVYDPDGISLTPALSKGEGEWYDLSGRKLAGKPTMKGIYVNDGRKVTIK